MSDNQYDMEAFLGELENQIDNWDAAKEAATTRGETTFATVAEGEHTAVFEGDIRMGKDKNNNPWMAIPFRVTGGESEGVTDSFFCSFNPTSCNEQGVMWGEVNMLRILSGLGMDLSVITGRREAVDMLKGLLDAKQQFILRAKKSKGYDRMNYYTAGVITDDEPSGPQQGDEVMFKLGKINTKGSYERDNGDGTHAVKVGNKLHPKVTLVPA